MDCLGDNESPEVTVIDQDHFPVAVYWRAPPKNQGWIKDWQDLALVFDDPDYQRLKIRDGTKVGDRQDITYLGSGQGMPLTEQGEFHYLYFFMVKATAEI